MMKIHRGLISKCLVLIFFLLVVYRSEAKLGIEFKINKIHGLLVFVESISDTQHRPKHFKKVFLESKFNTEESQSKISQFKKLRDAFYRGVDFGGQTSIGAMAYLPT